VFHCENKQKGVLKMTDWFFIEMRVLYSGGNLVGHIILKMKKKQRSAPGPLRGFCQQHCADFPYIFLLLFFSFLIFITSFFWFSCLFFYFSFVISFIFSLFGHLFPVKITACAKKRPLNQVFEEIHFKMNQTKNTFRQIFDTSNKNIFP